jgi:predicted  nucleic acid-binding Zn-ribbon protein
MAGQKQVCDIRAGKRMTVAQSNEHLRVGDSSAWNANRAGTLDPTRTHLNFEIGKGGVVKEVDQKTSISKRIKAILDSHGIQDPNENYSDEELKKPRVGVRTHANIILEGSRETMRRLAFGKQQVDYERGSDNSHITRSPEIEKWAKDMYDFIARKYGEENIAAFVVHLDESLPHIHCTLVPINQSGKLSYRDVFAGKDKYEYSQRTKKLHDELAEVNKKWGLERGDSVAVTGAQHKSYLQWLKEQIIGNKETMDEQSEIITRQATEITEQKQQLYDINGQIKQAEKKLKGLTTMLRNLEEQKEAIEIDIAALEEERDNGSEEAAKKIAELTERLNQLNAKILERNEQISSAKEQLRELAIKKHNLQNEYDSLMRQKNKELPDILDKIQGKANDTFWELAAEEMKKDYSAFEEFKNELPCNLRTKFSNLMEGSFFEDVAQRGEQMAAIGAALFLGYVDAATQIAQSAGGGGSPTSGWGRDKDEDDEAYMRRCCIMGRMMMKPAGKKRILRR